MWVNTQLQFLAREKASVISYYIHLLSKKLPKKQMAIPLSVFIVNKSSKDKGEQPDVLGNFKI